MNFFDEIITYITTQAQTVDPNLSFYDNDVFGEEDPSDVFSNRYFKCFFGATALEKVGSEVQEQMELTLEIYSMRSVNSDREYRDAYCKALGIKNAIIDPRDNSNQSFWTEIQATSVTPEPLDTDDKSAKFTIEFTILRDLDFR